MNFIDEDSVKYFFDNYIFTSEYSQDHCHEIKCFDALVNYKTNRINHYLSTEDKPRIAATGWFTNTAEVLCELRRLDRGVSCYVTPNPVKIADIQRRAPKMRNRIQTARRGMSATDEDVAIVRWLIVDIDPAPDPSGRSRKSTNSTNAELSACLEVRDAILSEMRDLQPSCLPGISGNGAFILLRVIDCPPTANVSTEMGRLLKHLGEKYSNSRAIVDTNTKNPSRAIAIPGSLKCKAPEETTERPYRRVSISYPT